MIKLSLKLSFSYVPCIWPLFDIVHPSKNPSLLMQPQYSMLTQNTIYHLNHHLCSFVWKMQLSDTRLEINTVFSFILCCINLLTCPLMLFSIHPCGGTLSTVIVKVQLRCSEKSDSVFSLLQVPGGIVFVIKIL